MSFPRATGARAAVLALAALLAAACTTDDTLTLARPPAAAANIDPAKYAAIVVDGSNGRTLYAANASASRYPASLTKMMTLYMLFEALDQGRIGRETRIPISAYAAGRPPSKIGFKAGQSISVADAIQALCVKSANDVAAAVAEYLAGSESAFAAQMTARARGLGMTGTVFRNASGLPDANQRTTAKDMATLGIALRQRFPHHYHFFGERSFAYQGKMIRGHNKLLEQMRGVDGIKTGYIRASGFNVVTSVNADGRKLVVVVMGGKTANERNAQVRTLVGRYLPQAARSGGGFALN